MIIKYPSNRAYTKVEALIDYFCNVKRSPTGTRLSYKALSYRWNWPKSTVADFVIYIESERFPDENKELYDFITKSVKIVPRQKPAKTITPVPEEQIVKSVIDYLNEKTGKKFNPKIKAYFRVIKDKLDIGYTFENFKTVIDTKINDWLGTKMSSYLRPGTLFGKHFDEYLNQKLDKKAYNIIKVVKREKNNEKDMTGYINDDGLPMGAALIYKNARLAIGKITKEEYDSPEWALKKIAKEIQDGLININPVPRKRNKED